MFVDKRNMRKLPPSNTNRQPALVDKFVPPPRPEVDIRQEFSEVVADAIAVGAQVMVYAVNPATARSPGMSLLEPGDDPKRPLDTWGVCLCDVGRVSPPYDIARFTTREAALAWARSRTLALQSGGATAAANAAALKAA